MSDENKIVRAPRIFAHAVATIKQNNWNPLGGWSSVLMDLSTGGCKLELLEEGTLKVGSNYYIDLPLNSFNIHEPAKLKLYGEVMWFNAKRLRVGIKLIEPKQADVDIINHILDTLAKSA